MTGHDSSISERPPDLAEFLRPPVEEVVLGIQFKTQAPINALHLGTYWQSVRTAFPKIREVPPLARQAEDMNKPPYVGGPSIQFGTGAPPLPRYWYLDSTETKLIQLQRDRFLHNWRKVSGDEEYPRFEAIAGEFSNRWKQFAEFCASHDLGTPQPELAEVTYMNPIAKGSCWETMADLPKVFRFISGFQDPPLKQALEAFSCNIAFRLPEDRGRLRISILPAVRERDKELVLRMNLTVRGSVKGLQDVAILEWFAEARWWIVKAFELLTTHAAHDYWGRTKKR